METILRKFKVVLIEIKNKKVGLLITIRFVFYYVGKLRYSDVPYTVS
jgi:hypothetical protein